VMPYLDFWFMHHQMAMTRPRAMRIPYQ